MDDELGEDFAEELDVDIAEVTLSPPKSNPVAKNSSQPQRKRRGRRQKFTPVKQRGTYKPKVRKSKSEEENVSAKTAATTSPICGQAGQASSALSTKSGPVYIDVDPDVGPLEFISRQSSSIHSNSEIVSNPEEHSYFSRVNVALTHQDHVAEGGEINHDDQREEKTDEKTFPCPSLDIMSEAIQQVQQLLPDDWTVIADTEGFHFLLFAPSVISAVQREIYMKFCGSVSVIVHCVPLPADHDFCQQFQETVVFENEDYQKFCQKGLLMCWEMMQYDVCVGADFEEAKAIWHEVPNTYVDVNPYLESSFNSSCRSNLCQRIIPLRINSYRCLQCSKVLRHLKERHKAAKEVTFSETTNTAKLSKEQLQLKVNLLQKKNIKSGKKISYLGSKLKKLEDLLETDGVDIDPDASKYFSNFLEKSNLSEMQQVFLDQQIKYASASDPRGHRWHPAMIRLAIKIKTASTAAYEILRTSGAISLPHSRTIFDYTHYMKAQVGVNKDLLKMFAAELEKEGNQENKYHVLIFDEIYISQNLVYRNSDGALLGYAYLDNVDSEIRKFENYLEGNLEKEDLPLATTMLGFMVKGLTSNKKCVIAAFPCKELNKNMLYSRYCEVLSQCEGAKIKILVIVCDGSPINRAFFKHHTPLHDTESGVVYDTLNIYSADERPLFFISDVAHLLKTIRNCLLNSRDGEGDRYRCLTRNGEKLLWKDIVRLYFVYRGDTLRHCFKLNSQNVFPNSYSTMKVKYAAQVLSQTVANALKQQKWRGTLELIHFIEKVNKFFDILNGAHSSQHIRQLKPDLAPYDDPSDPRFKWLEEEFWENYLLQWKTDNEEELQLSGNELNKTLLAHQTLEGIEITIRGFTAATKWLLTKGKAKFVMARAFSQDPLEQHYSLQRGALGGSSAPNTAQFLQYQVTNAITRQAKSHSKRTNVEGESVPEHLSTEPLPKKSRKRPKCSQRNERGSKQARN